MNFLAVDTLVSAKPPRRSYKVSSTGPFCSRIPSTFTRMRKLPNNRENYKERHDAPKPYSEGWNFWCLGHWFYGTIPKFIRQPLHLGCGGLCLKMGRGNTTKTNDNKVIVKFLKENIFTRFGTPRAIIGDNETHFCNRAFESLMRKYSITHKLSTTYYPRTNGQWK